MKRVDPTSAGDKPEPMPTDRPATVYIVDDSKDNLGALAALLQDSGYTVRTFDSGQQLLDAEVDAAPGCILLDNAMPGMTGIEVQNVIAKTRITLPIIFMSGASSYEEVFEATRNGAYAFLQKPITRQRLLEEVERAVSISSERLASSAKTEIHLAMYESLTSREKEIFHLLIAGKHNKMISNKLGISLRTVEYHRANIQKKMNALFLSDLIAIARSVGL
jgi:FixJ family two-component response regulator